ncbi:uncharacterized protein BX663DRAFT_523765 [Cokeromyces recurvatus]|uniref:uncharacterized protein n=1 Tax=Cokeromyces recurvatus TaxID=90255 RepID=UPI002220A158|nr:uncharacterized protein BX663DRAFT_523765 [Cokeromyces recurvatus]KAI7898696.1 hypothetical protein BX663DRAFT_523765 [Cokeromyces recurvatus]
MILIFLYKVQYKQVEEPNWMFEVLCELYFIQVKVLNESIDHANKTIRTVVQLLSNENLLKENGVLVYEIIQLFNDIEYEQGVRYSWKYLSEGFIHLSTRCEIMKGLAKYSKNECKNYIDHLLHFAHRLDSKYLIPSSEMIYKMVEEYPEYAFIVRFKLVEMQILPDLVTRLTVVYCRDIVSFLNGIFQGKSIWFLAQTVNNSQYFIKMKHHIITDIEANLMKGQQMNPVALSSAIRALAGIVGYFGIKLNEAEVLLVMKILSTTRIERIVKLLLCVILLSADQFLRKQKELSDVLGQLLQSEISEMPLLLLVYFQTDAIQQVEDMIRSVLAMQLSIHKLGLFEMQKLFRSLKTTSIHNH